ncbi:DNA repair protein complementing XP-G cells homolog [Drosophila guanche]|uniref:Blast:DNA repair protein complementing XP-G cells homolog n=1 Tax=Drosophila guanche TaxID=7266 RepID=A0A3B0JW17_DROGU|nr:DNA repair protein complementing XP-G cells homolog [Drosophila guanche]SPP86244.1 blast:DNA repair protein complementing XP-G cells homolog [Drosophila guanche]
MGVTGLWKLIEPCGKPVPVDTLEGKILAVDISIWLHQVVKGFQDSKGSALNNAHLLGLFHRLCKLLYYRVRPIFIFDGCTPQLKRDTIARRQQQRNKLSNEADRLQALLLQSLAREKVVQQALGKNAELLLKSPVKRPPASKSKNEEDDLFKLPELPSSAAGQDNQDESDQDLDYTSASATSDSSFDESTARHAYNSSLQAIDVRSQNFKNLPADVRHEILTDIKETRKQSSWGRLHELPARSDEFCSFQMKRLLKRRAVQESLEQAEQEMGGHTLTYSELCDFFSEEGIVTPTAIEQSTRQISSDEHTRFLLVRDLKKKALESAKIEPKMETIEELAETKPPVYEEKPTTSSKAEQATTSSKAESVDITNEFDAELAQALALSLEETQKVYDEKDYDYESDQELRLNRAQSKQLRHAAKGPARAYMIEYGGMNDEEVGNIMESTQLNDTDSLEHLLATTAAQDDMANDSTEEAEKLSKAIAESKKSLKENQVQLVDTDTDSDLEEVAAPALEICVDITEQLKPTNDLFAEIFEEESDREKAAEESEDDEDFIEVPASEEVKLIEDSPKPITDETIEVQESQEEMLTELQEDKETSEAKTKPDLDSILNDLKRKTEAIKDIKLTVDEPKSISILEPKPKAILSSILDDLQKEIAAVKNIKLEQVKLNNSAIIELSSDDEAVFKFNATYKSEEAGSTKTEAVIVLCDSDDNQKQRISPNKTPSKKKSIKHFFETSYVVKRTPDKSPVAENATPPGTPKVPQPFYRKRTPKSDRKRPADAANESDEEVSPTKRSSKSSKSLFQANEPEPAAAVDPGELTRDAAEALKSQKTSEELQEMADKLFQERKELEIERNRQDRMAMSISQRMSIDCQELLRLFGIPYIVAPMEAEAQCAFLNATELTHGTITDDSDIWLFGGRTVYKNFFAQNKHVLEFRAEQIEQTFNCNRGKLIQLACLVGSDYTTGIHGIGAVTALEIIASFSSASNSVVDGGSPAASGNQSVLATLHRFRDWWQAHKSTSLPPGSSARLALRKKLKNIELHEGFPNMAVVEAYLDPKVDDNRDAFSWGSPDVESIREFTRKSFGWTTSKTDDILLPVIKKINEKKIQGSIRNYFTAKSALRVQQPQVSKRVQLAIDKMSGNIDAETPEKPKKVVRTRRAKKAATTANEPADVKAETKPARPKRGKRKASTTDTTEEQPSTSQPMTKPGKCPRIPDTTEIIPQRERDMEQMRLNKAKAAEVLKKSAAAKDNQN